MEIDYYKKTYIIHEILKGCKGREFAFLGKNNANIRALNVRCIFDFERSLRLVNWDKNKSNVYISCSKLKSIPKFTFNPAKRSSETSVWFKEEFDKLVYESDLFIDLDGKIEDSLKDLKTIIEVFDEYEVPYTVSASGSKGFHVVIDGIYMPIKEIKNGTVYPHKIFIERLKEALELETLDLANNSLTNHLRKLNYTLVYPKDKENFTEEDMNVALPLSREQIKDYKQEIIKVGNVLSNVKLIRRGNLERFGLLELEEKKANVKNLLKSFFCEI